MSTDESLVDDLGVRRQRRRPYHPLPEGFAPPVTTAPPGEAARLDCRRRAHGLIQRYALLSGGSAALPLVVVDMLLVAGLQIRLIQLLARLYDVPFERERGRAALTGLLLGVEVRVVSLQLAWLVPGAGYLLVAGPRAVLLATLTYAVGRVFLQHFETGGTLLDFDPKAMRAHFQRELAMQRRRRRRIPPR